MAAWLAILPSILKGVNTELSQFEQRNQTIAQNRQIDAQIAATKSDAAVRSALRMQRLRQVLAANIASASGLGIDPGSASVLAVQEDSARAGYREAAADNAMSRYNVDVLKAQRGKVLPLWAHGVSAVFGGAEVLSRLQRPAAGNTAADTSSAGYRWMELLNRPSDSQPTIGRPSSSSTALGRRTERLGGRT